VELATACVMCCK